MATDSIFYTCPIGQNPLEDLLGDNLGCVTDEIGGGRHIVEFVSGGPNNYAYSTSDGKQFFKIGGITQNYKVQQQLTMDLIRSITMDLIRSMVTAAGREGGERPPKSIIFNDTEIARDKIKAQLFT